LELFEETHKEMKAKAAAMSEADENDPNFLNRDNVGHKVATESHDKKEKEIGPTETDDDEIVKVMTTPKSNGLKSLTSPEFNKKSLTNEIKSLQVATSPEEPGASARSLRLLKRKSDSGVKDVDSSKLDDRNEDMEGVEECVTKKTDKDSTPKRRGELLPFKCWISIL